MSRTRRSKSSRSRSRPAPPRDGDRLFRAAVDASADVIHIVDAQTLRLVDVNESACRHLGYTRAEFLRLAIPDFSPGSDLAKLRQTYAELFAGDEVAQRARIVHRHRDGRLIPMEIHRRGVVVDGRRLVVNVVRDVDEQTRAEQALRQSEARFRSLTNLSSDWYWEQDAEYRFTRIEGRNISPHAPSFTGRPRWEIGLEVEGGWDQHRALLDARKPFFDVLMWRELDGAVRYLQVSGEPVFAPDGSFSGYRGIGRDVSAQKRAEQLLRLEHQVARALAEAETVRAGLEAVLHAVCETEGWGCGRYFAVDESSGEARFNTAWSGDDPALRRFVAESASLVFRPGYGLVGKVLQTGEPLWSTDTSADARVQARQLAADTGARGAFVFAVTSEGRRIGVLAFSGRRVREPDRRLLQAASIIGSQVGQFVRRMRAEVALRESEARFRSLTQMSSDFFWETDTEHRFTQIARGKSFSEKFVTVILGKTAWEIPYTMPGEQRWEDLRVALDQRKSFRDFEFGRPTSSGVRYLSVSGEPRYDDSGAFLGYRGVGRDITDLVLARERIATLAYSDALTGLANRASLIPAFEQALERARRRGARLAALFVDLDGFKAVNDAWGHASGDRFLAEIGRRLRAAVRASDLVARLGGDEFFAVLEDVQGPDQVQVTAQKLLGEISRPFDLGQGREVTVTGSIGVAMFPDDAPEVALLIQHADAAMYRAKQAGKNLVRFRSDDGPAYARAG